MDNVLRLFSAAGPTVAEALALRLQPVLRERLNVCSNSTLCATERTRVLARLDREARGTGLEQFNRQIRAAARTYLSRKGTHIHRLDAEVFMEEVLVLTHTRLTHFDPQRGRFSTWLGCHILLRVYTDMQRSIDPTWQRPKPTTAEGQLEHRNARGLATALSFDAPTDAMPGLRGEDAPSLIGRVGTDAPGESGLLEEQCRERFVWALNQLSEPQKALLTRVHVHGEPQKEVAHSLGLSPARVSQKLRDTCEQLGAILGREFHAECGETNFCEALRGAHRE